MKKSHLAVAALFLLGSGSVYGFVPPRAGNCTQDPSLCQGPGQQQGQRNGRKMGPQDGTGPIHEPGTGGGMGAGQRNGRKIGPRDGSGPIHTPGTGGGTGAGQRRGRR